MSDGTRLRQTWSDALGAAETNFRQLLASYSSNEWKHVPLPQDAPSPRKGKSRAASLNPELRDVAVHRKVTKSGEYVYRAVLDVPATDENAAMDVWKAIITTPEIRQEWDPAVDASQLVELFDQRTRITKTRFTLGWPANPRDAVTISRLHQNASTIIDISTSLPRSADDPTYLRPSPPYVRSNVALFTWWIQVLPQSPLQQSSSPAEQLKRRLSIVLSTPVLRITCFWQHDLRALWNFNSSASICQQLSTMVLGLYKTVKTRGSRVPMLSGHGYGVSIERMRFQLDRQALTIEYAIHPEDDATDSSGGHSLDEIREYRRLTRSVECHLPASEGWDVQLSIKASSDKAQKLPWSASAVRHRSDPSLPTGKPFELIVLHVAHASLPDTHSILKVRVVIELSGPSCGIRLNGIPQTIQSAEERDSGTSVKQQQQILQDASSAANVSFQTTSSVSSVGTIGSGSTPSRTITLNTADRSATAEKSILARVRRSYIYFSSLLQEPEAKWKRTTEARGVSVTQLDSIDPTLVVYRAEATFVGLGLWDLYSALVSPGARVFWDKQHDDATLLEDVNELTELWHFKTKPAWPVVGRDAVLLKTVYKSPTTIHVFSFSADDPYLFPSLPLLDPSIIRTQVDLQGWAIEALNPTTTQLTLLEQSDPKGWSNKAMTIPSQMVAAVAGVGDFVIKCGGPPVVTRLSGARATEMRYEHEKGTFRVAYERAEGRRGGTSPGGAGLNSTSGDTDDGGNDPGASSSSVHTIECEIRCDMDTWASALDIVVDPPPQNVIALRRHRLSEGGGGLWLTLSHDALFAADERLLAIVRRGPMASARDKGVVMVNGARVSVDVEELAETEIRALSKRKRVKPLRIPLDQPPVVSVIRRLRAEWDADESASPTDGSPTTKPPTPDPAEQPQPKSSSTTTSSGWLSAPRFSSPLASFWSSAVDQATSTTQSAVAAVTPSTAATAIASVPSSSMVPMQHVLEALHWLRESLVHQEDGWTLVTDKGLAVQRKLIPEISPAIPVHKGEKVIEGVSAEEVSSIVTSYDCRKQWDDRFGSAIVFESFGAGCHTAFVVSKCGFPFRDRGFYLSSLMARAKLPQRNFDATPGEAGLSQDHRNVIFCVSASFHPESVSSFSSEKYNSYGYPIGRVFIDGWILETLDPYTKENYAIPSTRCTRIVAVDYAGSIPVAMNSMINAALPRSILAVETYIKGSSPLPLTRLPATGLVLTESKSAEVAPPGVVAVTGGGSPSWKLKRRDENRILVGSTYDPTTRTYNSSIFLTMSSQPRPEEATSRVSRVLTGATGTTPDARQGGRTEYAASPNLSSDRGEPSSSPVRSRSTERAARSSAFTIKGELKQSTDLVVAEVLVDSKLYPEGYSVQITSGLRDGSKFVSLTARSASSDGSTFRTSQILLPVASSLYTVPASPLHSSGLNADRPPRHLLRLTLPTAQFQISTVQDPLTGETRSAPPKPQWLLDLQSKGFTVQIEIGPGNGARKNGGGATVNVNGMATAVVSEKESLTALGRDELQDDRVSRMPVVQRCGEDGDVFPEELQVPLARAEELLDRAAGVHATDIIEDPKTPEGDGLSEEDTDKSQAPESPENGVDAQSQVPSGSGGLLGFLNAYPNTLTRWATSAVRGTTTGSAMQVDGEEVLVVNVPPPGSTRTMLTARTYPLSTVLIIALIGFLIGSLLRSLLSPADFIYVVTDVRDAEEVSKGWREIRRLMEIKYIVGGWDFQIAVVRRH